MVGIVQHYGTLTHIIIYTRVSACAIVLEVKEGAGLGVHRAVGVGVELAYSVACEGKRLLIGERRGVRGVALPFGSESVGLR